MVGLAAPQIGIAKRVAVVDISTGEDPAQKLVLINPEIVGTEGTQTGEEGCLSLPVTFREPVTRAQKVTLRARDAKGKEFEMTAEDLLARAFQAIKDGSSFRAGGCISAISVLLKRDLIRRKVPVSFGKADEW